MAKKRYKHEDRYKKEYIFINICLAIFAFIATIISMVTSSLVVWVALGMLFLFNGLWSINKDWYSWFPRTEKSEDTKWTWLILIIFGSLMIIGCIVYGIIK